VGDTIQSRFFAGVSPKGMNSGRMAPRLETIGLSTDRFQEFIEKLPDDLFLIAPGKIM
jgi:hypothetical protein